MSDPPFGDMNWRRLKGASRPERGGGVLLNSPKLTQIAPQLSQTERICIPDHLRKTYEKLKNTAQKRVFDAQIASSKSTHNSFSLDTPPKKQLNNHPNRRVSRSNSTKTSQNTFYTTPAPSTIFLKTPPRNAFLTPKSPPRNPPTTHFL